MATSSIPFSEYSLRNRDHILKVIKKYIFTNEKAQGNVLAIAEGSGVGIAPAAGHARVGLDQVGQRSKLRAARQVITEDWSVWRRRRRRWRR